LITYGNTTEKLDAVGNSLDFTVSSQSVSALAPSHLIPDVDACRSALAVCEMFGSG